VHHSFLRPLPSDDLLLVVTDRYSQYPEVKTVRSNKSSVVIPKLNMTFAVHGIPFDLTSDNGTPFNGNEFSRFLDGKLPCLLQNGHKVTWKLNALYNH